MVGACQANTTAVLRNSERLSVLVPAILRKRQRSKRSQSLPSESAIDLGMVTHVCVCGSDTWKILASFDDYEISTYSLEMYCVSCGNKAVTPTPLDHPDYCED